VSSATLYRVMCPYCTIGSATVDVQQVAGAHTANTQPRQCNQCERYFRIQVTMRLEGKPLEDYDRQHALRSAIKGIL
jgi:hypothetical protein